MSWFYIALLSPLLFAIVNLIDDNMIRHVYKSPYFGAIISGLFGAVPLVALALRPLEPVTILVGALATLAGFLTAVYYFFYFRALETESPSVVIAMFSLTPALIPVFARIFLRERLVVMQLVGFAVVLLASFGLGMTEVRKFKFSRALLHVSVAATIYAGVSLFSKYAFLHTDFFTGYMYFSAGLGIGGLYFLLILKFLNGDSFFKDLRHNSKKIISLFIIAEAIAIAAEFTQNLAISRGPVSLVKVIEGVQPVYVLLIALAFYRFSPKHFREAAEGGLIKKFALMSISIIGLFLIHIATKA
ncbi:MAG TPA: DMT family transporter [Candidatus Saccharimonadales bacterium]|nr:DMT family transporter [Candidatus Saccharimonadales bacterium]